MSKIGISSPAARKVRGGSAWRAPTWRMGVGLVRFDVVMHRRRAGRHGYSKVARAGDQSETAGPCPARPGCRRLAWMRWSSGSACRYPGAVVQVGALRGHGALSGRAPARRWCCFRREVMPLCRNSHERHGTSIAAHQDRINGDPQFRSAGLTRDRQDNGVHPPWSCTTWGWTPFCFLTG